MQRDRSEESALRNELAKVRKMANTDAPIGLANRRYFDEKLAAAVGSDTEFALILIDVDLFKRINDTHGHAFGDHVLKCVAATIGRAVRAGTLVARTGGEDFAIILSKAAEKEVTAVAERVRAAVDRVVIHKGEEQVRFSVSLGGAIAKPAETDKEIYMAADAALYRSKASGRNRVSIHDPSDDVTSAGRYRIYGS